MEDLAFGVLKGERAKSRWKMLCHSQKNKSLKISFHNISSNNNGEYVKWESLK